MDKAQVFFLVGWGLGAFGGCCARTQLDCSGELRACQRILYEVSTGCAFDHPQLTAGTMTQQQADVDRQPRH